MKTRLYMAMLLCIAHFSGCKNTRAEIVQGNIAKAECTKQLVMVHVRLQPTIKKSQR